MLHRFQGQHFTITSLAFSPDDRFFLSSSEDGSIALVRVDTGQHLCSLVSFRDGTWAVVDPQGRFDASNGGDVDGLHWVVGMEPIALKLLKKHYYDPGLLAKYMGFSKQPLRPVTAETKPPSDGTWSPARKSCASRGIHAMCRQRCSHPTANGC